MSIILEEYLEHEKNYPTTPITDEWKKYWAQTKKNPNKDIIPDMFTQEFSKYCAKRKEIWKRMSLKEQDLYWDILKDKNYDEWKWTLSNPHSPHYHDPALDYSL